MAAFTLIAFPTVSQGCNTQYATLTAILAEFGAEELAQLTSSSVVISGDLLWSAVSGVSLRLESDEVQAATARAVERLCQVCQRADAIILAALKVCGGTPEDDFRAVLVGAACDLARFFLYSKVKLESNSVVRIRYGTALKTIRELRSGEYDSTISGAEADAPEFEAPERVFTMDLLADYG